MRSGTAPLLGPSKLPDTPRITTTRWGRDRRKGRQSAFNGWRVGVAICASTAALVLVINIGLTIWASAKNGLSHGLATIQDGSCQKTKHLSLWLHLAINALSTALLAASNYCMQCLSSPTREEIDRAHSYHIWLDIGVPSVRNLRNIARSRIVLWWLLAFSGIPLHLLYNSAIFSTLSSQRYSAYIVSDEIINGTGIDWTATTIIYDDGLPDSIVSLADVYQNTSSWQNLTNEECLRAYGRPFVSSRLDVLALTSKLNASNPLKFVESSDAVEDALSKMFSDFQWLCSNYPDSTCDLNDLYRRPSYWTLQAYEDNTSFPIQYCLSKPAMEHCRLQMSLLMMCIIIFCNFMKSLCMYLVLRHHKHEPLVTLGDAIESFLQQRDSATEHLCLADKYAFASNDWDDSLSDLTRKYVRSSSRWFSSASQKRWLTCNILCISTLLAAGILLSIGLRNS